MSVLKWTTKSYSGASRVKGFAWIQ